MKIAKKILRQKAKNKYRELSNKEKYKKENMEETDNIIFQRKIRLKEYQNIILKRQKST